MEIGLWWRGWLIDNGGSMGLGVVCVGVYWFGHCVWVWVVCVCVCVCVCVVADVGCGVEIGAWC